MLKAMFNRLKGWADIVEMVAAGVLEPRALRRRRLLHTFETDAVAITLPGGTGEPDQSVLTALFAGASDVLEIPLDDLGGSVTSRLGLTRLVLFDTVPAGAGNGIRIGGRFEAARPEHRMALLPAGEAELTTRLPATGRQVILNPEPGATDALARLLREPSQCWTSTSSTQDQ